MIDDTEGLLDPVRLLVDTTSDGCAQLTAIGIYQVTRVGESLIWNMCWEVVEVALELCVVEGRCGWQSAAAIFSGGKAAVLYRAASFGAAMGMSALGRRAFQSSSSAPADSNLLRRACSASG